MHAAAAIHSALGWTMAAAGVLLLLSAWTIPYVVELVFALVLLHAGLVAAGTVRGRRAAGASVVMVCLALVVMVPARDAAWGFVDRALHASLGLVLIALGLAKAVAPRTAEPRGLFYGEAR